MISFMVSMDYRSGRTDCIKKQTQRKRLGRSGRLALSDSIPLYQVPKGSLIDVGGHLLTFHRVDGMYSYCTDQDGKVAHIACWAKFRKGNNIYEMVQEESPNGI